MFTTNFIDGTLQVYRDLQLIVSQPFKVSSTGEQAPWPSEADALAWWELESSQYLNNDIVAQPVVPDQIIAE